jgi:hypothetical protein
MRSRSQHQSRFYIWFTSKIIIHYDMTYSKTV